LHVNTHRPERVQWTTHCWDTCKTLTNIEAHAVIHWLSLHQGGLFSTLLMVLVRMPR
jgi:hypothetical protein